MGRKRIVSPGEILHVVPDIRLNKYISIPSAVHGYSLATEYMRNWILKQFPDNFFKTIHTGGKHVFADFKKFSRDPNQPIVKPAIAINPSINPDFNRENIDLVQGGLNIYTRRSSLGKDRFFSDTYNNLHIGLQFKQIELPFDIKIRVKSRSQQLDLLDFIKISSRIGSTQTHFIDMDCHVPYDIMIALAMDMGFELLENDGSYFIKDIIGFLTYLNSNSVLPFTYKLRTINGKCEFFIRLNHCHTHISCVDGISIDDGERHGSLDANFHIEFNPTLQFTVPALYSYYSLADHKIMITEPGDIRALYQIISLKPPEVNENNWRQYLTTEWVDESKHIDEIQFSELLENNELQRVMEHTVEMGLSPTIFMDVKLYNGQQDIGIYIDWENFVIKVRRDMEEEVSDIAIYADLEYINRTLANLDNIKDTRIKEYD